MGELVYILSMLISIYRWVLIIYIFMSWVPNIQNSNVGRFFARICEPYLDPFRKIIPPIGMIDLSPLAALFVLYFAQIGIQSLAFMFR